MRKNRRRSIRAITPVVGTILMIALTISVGFAAWAWARSAAVNSESNFGNAVSCNVAYLKEDFAIVNINYSSSTSVPQSEQASVWMYNYGNTTVYINEMWISDISNPTQPPQNFTGTNTVSTCYGQTTHYYAELPPGEVTIVTLQGNANYTSGSTYQFKALSEYSNTATYQQTR